MSAALALALHASSLSASRLEVRADGAVRLTLEVQTLSVVEVLPELDADGNLLLDGRELAGAGPPLFEYVARHYALTPLDAAGAPLPRLRPELLSLVESAPDDGLGLASQRLLLELDARAPAPLAGLSIEVSLFEVTSPGHRDFAAVAWEGEPEREWTFCAETPRLDVAPDPERVAKLARAELVRGARAGLAPELAAFAVALALASAGRGRRAALSASALFAGSLALAALAITATELAVPHRLVLLAAALAAPYSGLETALGRAPRAVGVEALLFAVPAGLAAAAPLSERLAGEPRAAAAGIAWAAGLALAQLALAGAAGLAAARLPRPALRAAAALVAAAGLARFGYLAWLAD